MNRWQNRIFGENNTYSDLFPYRYKIMALRIIPSKWFIVVYSILGILAAVRASPSDRMFDPLLLFVIPAIMLYMATQLHRFLKRPRTEDFAYITGISYEKRLMIARWCINEIFWKTLSSIICMLILFLSIRLVLCGWKEITDSGMFVPLILFEFICGTVLTILLFYFYWQRPARHDRTVVAAIFSKINIWTGVKNVFTRIAWRGSNLISIIAPKELRPYVTRQLLYLIHKNALAAIGLQTAAIIILLLLLVLSVDKVSIGILLTFAFSPFVVLFANASSFFESVERLRACPYYAISFRQIIKTNILICSLYILPFIMLLIGVCYQKVAGFPLFVFIICSISIIITFAYLFSFPSWSSLRVLLLTVLIFCVYHAIAGTGLEWTWYWNGVIIVPLLMLLGVYAIEKEDRK